MNQFHTPSFGDEVFEMNDTPMEQTQHQNASRRLSRISSLDHTTLDDDEEDLDYDVANTYGSSSSMMSTHQQQQQHMLPQHQQQLLPPAKPLAAYALFFRDTMTAIKQQNPACTLEQITAIALNMWESMDEKQRTIFDQRHELEKREYVRQLRDYQRNQQLGNETLSIATAQQQQQLLPNIHEEHQPQSTVPMIPKIEPTTNHINNNGTADSPTSDQIQLLTEAAAVQKCTREQCNKPAIINPDWEDEYCSNECVVIHCRNVFSEWARSLQNSPT